MSRSASSVVVVGSPGCRRVELFGAAVERLGLPAPKLVPYEELLYGRVNVADYMRPGALVRVESPGKNHSSQQLILGSGADAAEAEGGPYLPIRKALRLPEVKGSLGYPRQWYLGFCEALRMIGRQLAIAPRHRLMSPLAPIPVMFDKPRCTALLAAAGLPVPDPLGPITEMAELVAKMREARMRSVAVKLDHGSSASGVVLLQTDGTRYQATTTVEIVERRGTVELYNSRRIRRYTDLDDIVLLIDTLALHRVHAERWLPKITVAGKLADVRVVVIDGRARHVVVRSSSGPLTNLHLLNSRSAPDELIAIIGQERWEAALRSCERAVAALDGARYAGVDLLIGADARSHAIIEVNAFGDLLPGLLHEGHDTYAAELLATLEAPL